MPRTITLHPLSFAIGASVIGGAFLLASQTLPPAQVVWPPPKALMLNVFEDFPAAVSVPVGGSYSVLQVPTDRWLTVTGASLSTSVEFNWAELTASGSTVPKGFGTFVASPYTSSIACGGPVGWTFAPGSSILLTNRSTTNAQNLTGYSLIGYYSRN